MPKKPNAQPPKEKKPKTPRSDERIAFGKQLAALREAKGLTQTQVAERLRIGGKSGKGTVSAWENGVLPDILMLRRLLEEVYEASADALLWEEDLLPAEATLLKAFRQGDERRRDLMMTAATGAMTQALASPNSALEAAVAARGTEGPADKDLESGKKSQPTQRL